MQTSVTGSTENLEKHALTEQLTEFCTYIYIYRTRPPRLTEPGEELVQCSMHSVKHFNLFEFGIFAVLLYV